MTDPAEVHPVVRRSLRPDARTAGILLVLVLLGLAVRLDALHRSALDVPEFGDARAYHLLANNLADGEGYIRPFEFREDQVRIATAEYPPALPALLSVASRAGLRSETEHRTVLAGLGALTVGLIGLIGLRLGGPRAAAVAAGIAAVHPGLWNTDVTLMAEPLAAFVGAAAVLAALIAADRPSWRSFAALGACVGLGCLVRSEFLLLGPALVVAVAWRSAPAARPRLTHLAVGAAAMAALVLPWTARNLATFGEVVPISNNSGSVSRGANCDAAYRGEFRGLWVTDVSLGATGGAPERGGCFSGFPLDDRTNEAQAASVLRADGVAYLRDHLDEVPAVVAARVGRTVGLYRFEQQTAFAGLEGRNVAWERRGVRAFQGLALVALVGVAAAHRLGRLSWRRSLLALPIATALVTVAVTYGNPRFRAVAEPALVVLAALGIVDVVDLASRRSELSRCRER